MAFVSGLWLGAQGSSTLRILAEGGAVTLLAGYLLTVWNRPLLAQLLPTSGLIILANWLPLWGTFFVGIYARSPSIGRIRRCLVTTVTLVLSGYSCVAPLFGTPPSCCPSSSNAELQYQTTPHTCSPAAAATVLKLHGISATEQELAELCLTRQGTHWLGLYRGLKLKTAGTEWTVVAEPFRPARLRSDSGLPCVLSLNIDTSVFAPNIEHGFVEGAGHSVVCLQSDGHGCVTVFDPSPDFGVEEWNQHILDSVSSGVILRLVPRHAGCPEVAETNRRTALVAARTLTAGL